MDEYARKVEDLMSFEKFLVERLGVSRNSGTSKGDLCFSQAKVYEEESRKYDLLEYPGYIFRDLTEVCRERGMASDLASSLRFLRGGEDFAFRGLPDSVKGFTTNEFYDLFKEYLQVVGEDLNLNGDHLLINPQGEQVGYCSITYSRCGEPKDHILLVTWEPNAWSKEGKE